MATLNTATTQAYHSVQAPSVGHSASQAPSRSHESLEKTALTTEKVTIFQTVITEEEKNPVEAVKQRQSEWLKEQQQQEEKLEAARKAREEQEARAEAAHQEREQQLEDERQHQKEQMEQLNELQRKVYLDLLDVTQANLIAKEYQAIHNSFTLGSISSPSIDSRVDLYA